MSRLARRSQLRRFVTQGVLPFAALLLVLAVAFFRLQGVGPVTDAARALNKRFGYPAMMKVAGRRYFFAGIIRYKGRRSGREYAAPVWAVPTTDGFLISLPSGEGADWLKNVRDQGRDLGGRGARGDRAGDRVAFVAAASAAFVRPCGDRAVPEAEEALGAFLGYGRLRR